MDGRTLGVTGAEGGFAHVNVEADATEPALSTGDFTVRQALTVPGTREVVVHGGTLSGSERGLRLYRSGKLRGIIFHGEPGAFALDASGRYLLVARGGETRDIPVVKGGFATVDDPSYELVRLDLRGTPGPAAWPHETPTLTLPEQVLLTTQNTVRGLAW